MATKKFHKLKSEMFASDIDQKTICKILGKSQTYVTARMVGKVAFSLDDAYAMCDLLNLPYVEIPIYFPKGGVETLRKTNPKTRNSKIR